VRAQIYEVPKSDPVVSIGLNDRDKAKDADLTGLELLDPQTGKTEMVESDPLGKVDFGGLAVSRPEISADRPLGLRGEETRRAEGRIHGLHINIPSVFPGLQKGDVLSIGRKLGGRNLRVAEDYITVNELWRTARFVCDCGGEGR